jgi:uncharacterized membrane protein
MLTRKLDARTVALVGIMAAVTTVATAYMRFPIPRSQGYVHLGDVIINFCAIAFGPWLGMIIGGVGTAIADVIAGVGLPYAPMSLVVHGLQGFLVGYVAYLARRHPTSTALGVALGEVIMVVGYFVGELIVFGSNYALANVPFNIGQGVVGMLGLPLFLAVARAYPPLVTRGGPGGRSDSNR